MIITCLFTISCSFIAELYGMRFDGNGNLFLKKWEPMNMGTHMIDYENILKWVFDCTVGVVVVNLIFVSKILDSNTIILIKNY